MKARDRDIIRDFLQPDIWSGLASHREHQRNWEQHRRGWHTLADLLAHLLNCHNLWEPSMACAAVVSTLLSSSDIWACCQHAVIFSRDLLWLQTITVLFYVNTSWEIIKATICCKCWELRHTVLHEILCGIHFKAKSWSWSVLSLKFLIMQGTSVWRSEGCYLGLAGSASDKGTKISSS